MQGKGQPAHLLPAETNPRRIVRDDMWTTGQPWIEAHFADIGKTGGDAESQAKLRRRLRQRNGLTTRWQKDGLLCECRDLASGITTKMKAERRTQRGKFLMNAFGQTPLTMVELWNNQEEIMEWTHYRPLITTAKSKKVEDVVAVVQHGKGTVLFRPTAHTLPIASGDAHLFRELCWRLIQN